MYCLLNIFCLLQSARDGQKMPYQIPVLIRAKYDRATITAEKTLKMSHAERVTPVQTLLCFRNESDQGRVLIAMLGFLLENENFEEAGSIILELLTVRGQTDGFRQVGVETVSNLLATFV